MLRAKPDRLKTALIVLTAAALALGILTYFVIFFPSGSYSPVVVRQGPGTTSFGNIPTSTASSSLGFSSSTASSAFPSIPTGGTAETVPPGTYASEYSAPYPVSWDAGHEHFSVTGASLQGNQLILSLAIQMGNVPECVPLDLRFVADEAGTMKTPDSPPNGAFTFPDTQTCNGTPGATYSQSLVWTVDPSAPSYLFTTGGSSNVFFLAATSSPNGISVSLPSHSG